MKRVLLLIFSVTFISYASYAQKDNEFSSERLGELLNQYNSLTEEMRALKGDIFFANNQLYDKKKEWYNVCVKYLMSGKLSTDELENLLKDTYPEIDGEDLYNEIKRALDCIAENKPYIYRDVPEPTNELKSIKSGKKDKDTKDKKKEKTEKDKKKEKPEKNKRKEKDEKEKPVKQQDDTVKKDPVPDSTEKDKAEDKMPPVVDNDGKVIEEKLPVGGDDSEKKDNKKKSEDSPIGDLEESGSKTKGKDGNY